MTVVFGLVAPLSTSLLLPMRLIVYNQGNRKLLITSTTMDLPQPIVVWLQESVQYRDLIDRILPASEAHLTLPPHEQAARQVEQVRSKVVAAATESAAPQPAENEVYHL
jgi:hypothetical protein